MAEEFSKIGHSVKFKMEVENYTNNTLWLSEVENHSGYIQTPADNILPGRKEATIGHKTSNTATGCIGTMAWRIGSTDYFVIVMYSVPYNQNWSSNQLAVGITNSTCKITGEDEEE